MMVVALAKALLPGCAKDRKERNKSTVKAVMLKDGFIKTGFVTKIISGLRYYISVFARSVIVKTPMDYKEKCSCLVRIFIVIFVRYPSSEKLLYETNRV